jgi:hypothetical protein
VLVCLEPIDMRKVIDRLFGEVIDSFELNPQSKTHFISQLHLGQTGHYYFGPTSSQIFIDHLRRFVTMRASPVPNSYESKNWPSYRNEKEGHKPLWH